MTAPARLRLLVTTTTLPRWEGDAEPRFVLDLAVSMQDRFDITILAPAAPGAAAEARLSGVRVLRYRYAPFAAWERLAAPGAILPNLRRSPALFLLVPLLLLGQFIALARWLRRERFDAVHCHWLVPQGAVYALLSMLRRVPPALLTCHGGDAFALRGWLFRWIKRRTLGRVAAVTCVSGEIAEHLAAIAPERAALMRQVPMGVDLARFSPDPRASEARRARRMAGDAPRVLFVGRLADKKGLPVLLDALRREAPTRLGLRLRIVGDGPLRESLEASASDLIGAGRVEFAGALPHERLPAEFAAADLFCAPFVVAPDGDREGMPTVLLEAAASGIAALVSDVGGCRDLIRDGETGWLVPPGDADRLAAALADAGAAPGEAERRAALARERVAGYGWRVIAERHAGILHAILPGAGAA